MRALRLAVALLPAFLGTPVMAQDRPNVVYMLVDNWGWGDISIQGSVLATPRIDEFAAQGLRLTNFNVQNQCTPTRSALQTGRLPIRSGTWKVPAPGEPDGLAVWEYTLGELMSDAGYATSYHGKWHLGAQPNAFPNAVGYDEFYGPSEGTNASAYTSTPQWDPAVAEVPYLWEGVKGSEATRDIPFDLESRGPLDREVVRRSLDFMRRQVDAGQPFFSMIGFTFFHPPMRVHPDFEGVSGAGVYSDMKMELDHNIGVVLDALDEMGITDNTIVVLTGDNGAGYAAQPGAFYDDNGSNGPWRGGLSTAYEGGLRTPAMIRWPGRIEAGKVSDEIVADLDVLPTLAAFVGSSGLVPADRPIDGVDQSAFLLGEQEASNREHVVVYVGERVFAVKWRNIKMHFFTAEGTHAPVQEHTFPPVYDIKEDQAETRELWGNDGYAHTWVSAPIMRILGELAASQAQFPNIRPGQRDFPGYR